MKMQKYSSHECEPKMEEHFKALIRDWKETDNAMKDPTCENQGGPGMKILGGPRRPPRKLKKDHFKNLTRKPRYSLFYSVLWKKSLSSL